MTSTIWYAHVVTVGRFARVAAVQLTILCGLAAPAVAQDPANSAWIQGDTETARRLYSERLAADSTDQVALHRLGLLVAWEGEYERALELLDRLIAGSDDHVDAIIDRARVLSWSGDATEASATLTALVESHPDNPRVRRSLAGIWAENGRTDEAVALYDSLARSNPADTESRLGLARLLSWSNDLDSAAAVYSGIVSEQPDHPDALAGRARMAAWSGDLVEAEVRWRQAAAQNPTHAASWIGLGQTLRWQGRIGAARSALAEAQALDPEDPVLAGELEEIGRSSRPVAASRIGFDRDSDGNRILTGTFDSRWAASPHLTLRAITYARYARDVGPADLGHTSAGVRALATAHLEPGWTLTGGLGATGTSGSSPAIAASVRVSTPGRYRIRGSMGVSTQALDETAALMRNGVTYTMWDADATYTPNSTWRFTAGLNLSRFYGSEANRRAGGWAAVSRPLGGPWRVGLVTRSFGFEDNLNDGYFDPDLYLLTQVPVEWTGQSSSWHFLIRAAPGVQKVGSSGSLRGALGLDGQLRYEFGPGREIGGWASFSSTGMSGFSTGRSDYRYASVGVRAGWVF
ncbi:MAG: tetratricopeptide repeat protein [Gemmatimonadota bacterium]|nr:tetratricopeptide repeat protein [Gemmatimonadota bacterium]